MAALVFISASNADFRLGRNIEIMVNLYRELNMLYVDGVDSDKMLEDAATGMVERLDPYTEYIPEEAMADFEVMTSGKYGGIGALIRKSGEWVVISQPYKGFPADKAGLKAGDRLMEINGQDARGMDVSKVSSMLKGDPGTTLRLKVEKFYTGEEQSLTIRRERITISGISYFELMPGGIGYIRHDDFTEDCSNDMRKAIEEMRRGGELKGLVLDVRSNGGGILQEAVKILSFFVPKGTEVVSMKGRIKEMDATFNTESEPIASNLPVVVLTNSGTASAAEIVSGALQDLDRAVLMGQRTFGKGLVQSTRPLGFNSYLKVTTAKYYIPSGRCIQAIDYAHRNEDGSVGYIPDSLVREYSTRDGRKVYDGGGIMPDVVTEPEYVSRFAWTAYLKGYIEEYVDSYCKRHPLGVDMDSFRFGDADYADFSLFMQGKDMDYESETQAALKILKNKAQEERYSEKIGPQIESIENALKEDKNLDLKINQKELTRYIENEIITRFYYAQGASRYRLKDDRDVKRAVQLLSDRDEYLRISSSQDTRRK